MPYSSHWQYVFCIITKIFNHMYFTLLIVVILTAIALVAVALGIANAISPRSFNPQKGEAYECGIPTRGKSWMQFKVGYYLFAILFLMFDVETVFLFPWAAVVQDLGVYGLVSIIFFLVILVLGLAHAWRKGAFEWK
jgi:NADH-quinone oxidoreductase subunit A